MSMSKFRSIKNEPAADNSIAKTNEPTHASKNNLSSSIQGIKFLNFPLINEEMGSACPNLKVCMTYKGCSWDYCFAKLRQKKEAISVKNERFAGNVIAESKNATHSVNNNLDNSVQGINFMNIPLFNERIEKDGSLCPYNKACPNDKPSFRKTSISENKTDLKENSDINRNRPMRNS